MNKKLLYLVSHLSFFLSHRLQIASTAKKKGYDVIVAFGELDADTSSLRKDNIDLCHIPIDRGGKNFLKDLKSCYLIWKLFKNTNPNIVHLITIKPYLYGGIIARLAKVQCVVSAVSGLGSLFIQQNLFNRFLRLILYPIYQVAFNHPNQCIIFQNNEDAKLFINRGIINSNKVKLLKGSGVNLKKFTQYKELRRTPTICFVGRLLRDKGINEFVSAANIIKKRNIKAKFLVAGEIDKKNPTGLSNQDLIKIKKNNNIQILGFQKNIAKIYAKSHIVCLPSYREGFPKTLIEAAAASRAIITTNVPGCKDAIIKNKTGILVPAKDPIKLADAIEWLIENPDIRISMGKRGRQLAQREFRIEKIVQAHMNIYKDLLKIQK
tara:strand:- start:835 stop:1971 length:1137 start_codon:yes stop_codon:yes gene_type:complete